MTKKNVLLFRIKSILYDIKNLIKYNNPYQIVRRKIWAKNYYKKFPIEEINLKKSDFDIYTIAFNNVDVIDYQIRLLKKYLKDKHFHIIADNSNKEDISKRIKDLCLKYDVWYIKLPENILFCSHSHWAALNYLYKNYVEKRKPKYFWLLDHDIFPIKDTSILERFWNQDFYGYLVDKNRRWYIYGNQWMLWPWFSFYKYWVFKKFNFFTTKWLFPRPYALDTWGWNRRLIFRKFQKDKINFVDRKLIGVDENGEREISYDICIDGKKVPHNFSSTYEIIGNKEWLHKQGTYLNNPNDAEEVLKYKNSVAIFLSRIDSFL